MGPLRSRLVDDLSEEENMKRSLLLTSLVLMMPVVPVSASILYTFDTSTELTSNFTANRNGVANENFVWNDVGGLGGGGGVRFSSVTFPEVPTNGWDATNVHNTALDVQNGSPYFVSVMVKTTPNAAWGTSWRYVQLGFINLANRSFNGELADTGFIAPRVNSNFNVQFQTKNTSAGPANINGASNAAAEFQLHGNWLKFTLFLQQTDAVAGTFAYSMEAQDFGADGVTPGILYNVPAPGTITLSGLAGIPLYPAFRSAGPFAGDPPALTTTVFYDNFTAGVVPEPAGLAVLGLAGLVMGARRR
jgi:hypothetical protein